MEAGKCVKEFGLKNDLLDRIKNDQLFAAVHDKLDTLLDPLLFVGRAPEQVSEFLDESIRPILEGHSNELNSLKQNEIKV